LTQKTTPLRMERYTVANSGSTVDGGNKREQRKKKGGRRVVFSATGTRGWTQPEGLGGVASEHTSRNGDTIDLHWQTGGRKGVALRSSQLLRSARGEGYTERELALLKHE